MNNDIWFVILQYLDKTSAYRLVQSFPPLGSLAARIWPTKRYDLPQCLLEFGFEKVDLITGLDDTCMLVKRIFHVLCRTSHIKQVKIIGDQHGMAVLNHDGDLVVVDLESGDKSSRRGVHEILEFVSWSGLKISLKKRTQDDMDAESHPVTTFKRPFSLTRRRRPPTVSLNDEPTDFPTHFGLPAWLTMDELNLQEALSLVSNLYQNQGGTTQV